MEQQQKAFAEAHPEYNITWVTEIVGEDKCQESVLKDVGAAADVFMFASDQLPSLVEAGAIAKLGGSTETMVKETNSDAVIATATVDGSLYAIPFTHNTFFMYYDKTLLGEADIVSLEKITSILSLPADGNSGHIIMAQALECSVRTETTLLPE